MRAHTFLSLLDYRSHNRIKPAPIHGGPERAHLAHLVPHRSFPLHFPSRGTRRLSVVLSSITMFTCLYSYCCVISSFSLVSFNHRVDRS